ncbi:hypothetical protein [Sphingobium sp. ZW T5_29]|uniref:hypothetical protein n=1 Tax=Sphingobium sp. ZW T5_29 TaxID=3378077 RepID=UPI0038549A84
MKPIIAMVATLLTTGCSQIEGATMSEATYKISEEGGVTTRNQEKFEYTDQKMFERVQNYRIVANGDVGKQFHILLVSIKQKIGKKTVGSTDVNFLPIKDGFFTYECSHLYTINLSDDESRVDDPICEFEVLGAMKPNIIAKNIAKS